MILFILTKYLIVLCYSNNGEDMKKYGKLLVIAVILGSIMAYLFYKDINKEVKAIMNKDDCIYLFQVGVFKSLDNALEFSSIYQNKIVYKDDDYYRVVIDIAYNNKELLETFYNNLNIEYYIKEIRVNKSIIDEIKQYEVIRERTTEREVIYSISNKILELFNTYINDN